ncbi:hypothetical protein BS78_02G137100 [Paspalum vaginatum]|nr:hypothetical protein BS78_02G137100 [Paspalum vaginatum]
MRGPRRRRRGRDRAASRAASFPLCPADPAATPIRARPPSLPVEEPPRSPAGCAAASASPHSSSGPGAPAPPNEIRARAGWGGGGTAAAARRCGRPAGVQGCGGCLPPATPHPLPDLAVRPGAATVARCFVFVAALLRFVMLVMDHYLFTMMMLLRCFC